MTKLLNTQELVTILKEIDRAIRHDQCWQCECLQGFLTQLATEIPAEIRPMIEVLQISPRDMHACLGCEPCPPADLYANHLRTRGSLLTL